MTALDQLSRILQQWIRRMRLQRAALWMVRGLAIALALSLLVGGLGLVQAKLLRREFLALTALFAATLPVAFGLAAYFWKVSPVKAARRFDRIFRLDERVSTALELSGADHSVEMIQSQLDDALSAARRVRPRRELPLRFKRIDALLALVFAVALLALWFRGEALFVAASHQREVETAIAEQQTKVEEIIKAIDENSSLTDEQKQALTEPLQQALQDLKETKFLEGAVSILTATGEKMQTLSAEQGGQTMQALKESGGSLAMQEGSPLNSLGKDLASGNFAKAAADLQNMDLSQMSSEELRRLAQQLDAMAESLASANPQLAQALKDAAAEIRAGELANAQNSMDAAAGQLAGVAQQAAASQAASQAAGQMQAGAGKLLAAGGSQNAQAQGGDSTGQNNNGGAGSGSGSGSAPDSNQSGGEANNAPIPQNNGAGDGGESAYEQIYAPSLLGGANGETLGLPASGSDGEVIGESPATATDGQSLVPYSEVFSQYNQINSQAIENGDVPSQFLELIKNYFSSIQP
ncbi:MAG: DUF1542 domain-containing protein [Anaerolineales bacterium]|nr:DUF1542 domain-containing protein [Anaerolineales bacterium]